MFHSFSMVDPTQASIYFLAKHEQWHPQLIRSNIISPSIGSIEFPVAKLGPAKCKVVTSPLQKETNENDKVDDQDLAQLPKPIC
jgi:hypothetical protein